MKIAVLWNALISLVFPVYFNIETVINFFS